MRVLSAVRARGCVEFEQPIAAGVENSGMGEHEDKQQRKSADAPESHSRKAKPIATKPSTEQVDQLAVKSAGVEIGDECVFGDHVVGTTSRSKIPIVSSHAVNEASVRVSYSGPSEILIEEAPTKLRPDVEGSAGWIPLQMVFQPTTEGSFRGTVTIEIDLADGTHQTHHVLVAGRAHAEGTPDWDERDREVIHEKLEAEEHQKRAQQERADEEAIRERDLDTTPHPTLTTGQADGYNDQKGLLEAAIGTIYNKRRVGVESSKEHARGYLRPPSRGEGLSTLAKLAIETASMAVGAVLGGVAEELVERGLSKLAGEAVGAIVEEGVKKGGALITEEKKPTITSDDEVNAFHDEQTARLADAEYGKKKAMVGLNARLFKLRTHDPILAKEFVKTLTAKLEANFEHVVQIQHDESSRQWIHYVAQSSLGKNEHDGERSDIARANIAPGSPGQRSFDGLVDLTFSASATNPQQRVHVVSGRVTGITTKTVEVLANQSLLDTNLPIRALGSSPIDADLELAIVRDERNNFVFTDNVGNGNHWFERKGGGDPELGARAVLEEIASEPLGSKLKAE